MKNTVLMVIDIQNAGINNRPANKEQFIENVVQLIDCARTNDLEVIHVRQNNPPGGILETGIPGWEIYHEVAPVNDEIIIDKFKCSAFLNTNLSEELQKRGTENIIMAAVLAEGTTIIENVAEEPEIVDLANFLNKMGAKIKGAGTDTIKIEGVHKLHAARHAVIPDRIETGTFMVAAAITRGDVLIKNVVPDHVKPIIAKLKECGVEIYDTDDGMRVIANKTKLRSTDIKTLPYPGFPTDMQSQFMSLLTTVEGTSVVIETVFENRYMHIGELARMGANIKIDGKSAVVSGKTNLMGAEVISTDLRAGAALVLAGLFSEGKTEISEIYHIERGYEDFVKKFKSLGADIERVEE